ncbi:MAG TPA: hypothetical protein VEF33_10445 [Syntrophales bacterium]|nr:hypothetical protein [Syntrophales bacterium]
MTTLLSAPIMMRLAEHYHHHTGIDTPEIALFVFCFIAIVLMAGLVLKKD